MHTAVSPPPERSGDGQTRSFGILSTYPSTSSGIAAFSAGLAAGLTASGASVDVVRSGPSARAEDALVTAATDHRERGQVAAVAALNGVDVAIVQHEYGIDGGADGASILDLVAALEVPTVVVAHTALSEPGTNERVVLERLCAAADAVVVLTETERQRLIAGFGVEEPSITVIPHGAILAPASSMRPTLIGASARLLTWGALGPGTGIEWAIDALAELDGMDPRPEYHIAGPTDPEVLERQGEIYRDMLVNRAATSRSTVSIRIDDVDRDLMSLAELIQSADVVVLPYDSADHVTSSVLVDSVAAGRPVVSTSFPHAVELLASGAGIVVPRRDPVELGRAIRAVLTNARLQESMAAEARRLAPALAWTAVARRYAALGEELVAERMAATT